MHCKWQFFAIAGTLVLVGGKIYSVPTPKAQRRGKQGHLCSALLRYASTKYAYRSFNNYESEDRHETLSNQKSKNSMCSDIISRSSLYAFLPSGTVERVKRAFLLADHVKTCDSCHTLQMMALQPLLINIYTIRYKPTSQTIARKRKQYFTYSLPSK